MKTQGSYWAVAGLALVCLFLAIDQYDMSSYATDMRTMNGKYIVVNLVPERPRTRSEMPVAIVEVGPLAIGLNIAVADKRGKIIGSVSPFGLTARQGRYKASIALPDSETGEGEITLQIWVVDSKTNQHRAPTNEELLSVELSYDRVRPD